MQGIILHIIIVLHQRCLNCSECLNCLYIYTCNYNIRVTHKMVHCLLFLRIRSTEGSSADCSLFILSLHALALHLAVKILLNLSVWRFEHVGLTYICRLYFPPECQQDPLLLRNSLLSENIPNIWHKSSTKHKEVRPDCDKNDNANYAPSHYLTWSFTNGSRLPFLKKYSIKCEKI